MAPRSQGSRGVCSLFAVTVCAEAEAARVAGTDPEALSEEYLVWAANDATGRGGDQAMFYEAVHGLAERGICKASLMPFEGTADDARTPPEAARADAEARRGWRPVWIRRWNVDGGLTGTELELVKRELAAGHPVAVGTRWPKNPVFDEQAVMQVPESADGVFDGHSIAFVGYRDGADGEDGWFLFRNHAGPGWGDGGYGRMPYRYARLYVNDAVSLRYDPAGYGRRLPAKVTVEAESMVVASTSDCSVTGQDMRSWGRGMWSGGKHLFGGGVEGGWVELLFPVSRSGRYDLEAYLTCAPDYGIVDVDVNGDTAATGIDIYSGRVSPTGAIPLGTVRLRAGENRIRVRISGRNPSSAGTQFGFDKLDLFRR